MRFSNASHLTDDIPATKTGARVKTPGERGERQGRNYAKNSKGERRQNDEELPFDEAEKAAKKQCQNVQKSKFSCLHIIVCKMKSN